jgi:hypothetical protein
MLERALREVGVTEVVRGVGAAPMRTRYATRRTVVTRGNGFVARRILRRILLAKQALPPNDRHWTWCDHMISIVGGNATSQA